VQYLYGWFTNETHTTWYKHDEIQEEVVPDMIEEPVIENKPIKRRRKTK
jgi:hypothetical protein